MAARSASLATFPIAELLEALHRWQRESGPDAERDVAAGLERTITSAGARGAILVLAGKPLKPLTVRVGSLAETSVDQVPDGALSYQLASHEGRETFGRLVVDAGASEPDVVGAVARFVGLAADAAWSRAIVHDQVEGLAALEAATRAVAAELDIDRVLQIVVDRVRELVGARYAALGVADRRGQIERFLTSGISPQARAAIGDAPHGHGLLGLIIHDARTIRADDIAHHPEHYGFPPNHPSMRSFLGAPVLVKGRSIGNLYLADKLDGRPFTQDDERLVEMFAVHAGIAIDNARLHDQVQRLAVVDERERIGRDLHDGIIQAIYAVGLSLEDVPELVEGEPGRDEAIARVDRAIDALNLVIADIRSYILRLQATDDDDPVAALARLGEELGLHAVVDLDLDLDDGADALRELAPNRRSDLLFIAREALSNVARHADATRARLAIEVDGDDLVLEVEDNGRGFDAAAVPGPDASGRHQGLANMRDRALGMAGTFAIERPDSSGTRIIVRVPVTSHTGTSERAPAAAGDS
jgi:signal transduction histidine kinase